MAKVSEDKFIPCTREIEIGGGVVYRPIRSWHSGTFAGEKVTKVNGAVPLSVTHRIYWNKKNPEITVSAFLSYPGGMGACNEYFWEIMPGLDRPDDVERYFSEEEMEKVILLILNK